MLVYVAKRILVTVVLGFFATVVIFFISSYVPGDPVVAQLGDLASSDPVIVAEYRARWGLDLPIWEQYWRYLTNLLHGDLGISILTHRPVLEDILQRAPATLELSTVAFILALLFATPLGIAAAVWRDKWVDHCARFISLVGVSSPVFWLAFVLLTIFYGKLGIAPGPGRLGPIDFAPPHVTGLYTIDSMLAGDWTTFRVAVAHLILPSLVLCAAIMGVITRTMRASMLDTLSEDYIRVARAKGLRERIVIIGHALPNALIPVVTLAGLTFADLLTGTVMTETIFSWPGLGRYTFRAAVGLDIPAIMGITIVFALAYLLINLLVDMSYAFLDPRVVAR